MMEQTRSLLLLSVLCLSVSGESVEISQGRLKGTVKSSRDGAPFDAFLAIPYAKPPVGELRFKEPVPHPGWSGERDATKDAPVCAQSMAYFQGQDGQIFGQEDCLYLNVYAPQRKSDTELLPVMVFIHGGGFVMGQATSDVYGPEYFMDHNIVLVTIQYRLGVLGFLSIGDPALPGNFGMKDQVLALRWIQANIQKFGGDPKSVTIFGESAGAASVEYHLVSPLSKGLFQKAILQSGSFSCSWALVPQDLAKDRGITFAILAGCPTAPVEQTLDCLRNLPVNDFVKIHDKLLIWDKTPMIRYTPVIEPYNDNESFLPQHPLKLPRSSVPVIMGINMKEGGILGAPYCSNNYSLAHEVNADTHTRLALGLSSMNIIPYEKTAEFVDKMVAFYLNGQPLGENNIDGLIDMTTDICFSHAAVKSANEHLSYAPVYFYLYDYELPASFNDLFGKCAQKLGVTHADELYQFFRSTMFSNYTLTEEEEKFSNQMVQLWTSFARTGSPDHPLWAPVRSQEINYIYFNRKSISYQTGLFTERMKFLDTLPLIYNKNKKENEKTEL